MLPNFFCIGAAKAGTTTLQEILTQHSNIYLPRVKETKFFTKHFDKGLSWYEREFFGQYGGEKAVGEIYPCMDDPRVPQRLRNSLGADLKIIVMMRNPVDRAYSNYLMLKTRRQTDLSFSEALQEMPHSLVEKGLYGKNIERFLQYFPINRMKFIVFETDFLRRRHETISAILRFVDVEHQDLNLNVRSNSLSHPRLKWVHSLIYERPAWIDQVMRWVIRSHTKRVLFRRFIGRMNAVPHLPPKLPKNVRTSLMEEYFLADIERLEKLLGRDLSIWYPQHQDDDDDVCPEQRNEIGASRNP